jgi:large repetitive protein
MLQLNVKFLALVAPTATDNCGGLVTVTNNAVLPISTQGTTVVTWTYDDGNGNTSTQTQNVVIDDITAPVADLPVLADVTAECEVLALVAPTATDNCGSVTVTHDAVLPINAQGTTLITWTYDDGNGNTSTQTQNVVIDDITIPTITCPTDLTVDADAMSCEFLIFETIVYDIPFSQLVGVTAGGPYCNGTEDAFVCGGNYGLTWNSTETITPVSIDVEFYQTWNDNMGALPLTLNGTPDNNYNGPNQTCVNNLVNLSLDPTNYNIGGLNDITINTPSCFVLDQNPNPTWAPQSFARVSVKIPVFDLGTPIVVDNCAIASVTNNAADSYPLGTHTIQWTVTDNGGNIATCNQQLTVVDATAPVADLPVLADVTAECEVLSLVAPTATDNCSAIVTVTNDAVFPISTQGTTVVTWTYDDGNGNTSTQTQNVVIDDITAPVADLVSLPDLTDACSIASLTAPTATDNCGLVTVTHDAVLPIMGTSTITWSYDDGNGNITTQTQEVIINDLIAPIPDIPVLADVTAECEVTMLVAPTATDNCGGLVTVTHDAILPINAQGTTVVTWTFADANMNITTQTQNVVITDITAPVADIPVLADEIAECEVWGLMDPTATDNCGGFVMVSSDAIYPITAQGTTVVTWTYEDMNGNTSTQTQNVVIDDITGPTPDMFVLNDVNGQCEVTTLVPPTATDNCWWGLVTVTHDAVLPISAQGTTVVTWTYEDENGNTTTQTQNVVIEDTQAPIPDINGFQIKLVRNNSFSDDVVWSLVDASSTVVAGGGPYSNGTPGSIITIVNGVESENGPYTFFGTTAGMFNDNQFTFEITCNGTLVQTGSYMGGQTINFPGIVGCQHDLDVLTDACSITSLTDPTATDNCGGSVTVTHDAVLPIMGTSTITWSYEDENGNISTQTQEVIINDIVAPVPDIPVLADVTAECEVTILVAPTATDNCGGLVTVIGNAIFPITAQGTTVVTWTYFDANLNFSTQTQNVVITDITAPLADIPVLADVTAECEVLALVAPTATDNCAGIVMVSNDATLPIIGQGTTIVTWTYDDGNGNTSTQTQNVVIDDISGPVADIPVLADVTAECEVLALVAPTATDNCGGLVIVTNDAVLPINVQGTTVVTWTYEDSEGNTTTQTQDVVIDDITAPVADLVSLPDLTDACSIASLTSPTATDNCGGSVTVTHDAVLPIMGTSTITWSYDDGNGNISTQTQEVIINDIIAPVPDLPSLTDITSECEVTVLTAPTGTDNCGGPVTVTHDAILPINAQGTTVVTWTFADANMNSTTLTQNVILTDITAPVADVLVLADVVAECEVTSLIAPTATDNCGGVVTVTSDAVLPIIGQGSTTITWTYDDGNGNTSTQTQNIVIDDISGPVADLPVLADVIDVCEVTMLIEPTATDNCGGLVTVTSDAVLPITAQGTTVVTWTYEDVEGNTSTQTQNVVLNDITFPVADAVSLADLTADCEITSWVEPTATDNCVGTITGVADVSLPVQGTTTITWSFEDANGNITTQTQQVIINDATDPVLDAAELADITGDCEVVSLVEPTATDNCFGIITGVSDAVLPITAQGTTVVTWTFTDGNGNFVTQTQNVVLEDLIAPVPDVADLDEVVECFELTVLTDPTATDNCGGLVTVTNDAMLPITESTTVTWTYEDVNGNVSTQTQSIVINTVDVSVTDASPVLTANAAGATYQWVDCDNANAPIAGEIGQSFTATANGNYAVEVTQNGCTEISDCITVTNVGLANNQISFVVDVYPNPTADILNVRLSDDGETIWSVTNVTGQIIREGVNYDKKFKLDFEDLAPGVYMLNIKQNENNVVKRIVRK